MTLKLRASYAEPAHEVPCLPILEELKDEVLSVAQAHPASTAAVIAELLLSDDGREVIGAVCGEIGWGISRHLFDLAPGESWELLEASAPVAPSERERIMALQTFRQAIVEEGRRRDWFGFLLGIDRVGIAAILDGIPADRIAILGACLKSEDLDTVFSALPREIARRAVVGVSRARRRLPQAALDRLASGLASELARRRDELQRLRESVPPPPRPEPAAGRGTETERRLPPPPPPPEPETESRQSDDGALRSVLAEVRGRLSGEIADLALLGRPEVQKIVSEMPAVGPAGHA